MNVHVGAAITVGALRYEGPRFARPLSAAGPHRDGLEQERLGACEGGMGDCAWGWEAAFASTTSPNGAMGGE
jgi:hypothetical protein